MSKKNEHRTRMGIIFIFFENQQDSIENSRQFFDTTYSFNMNNWRCEPCERRVLNFIALYRARYYYIPRYSEESKLALGPRRHVRAHWRVSNNSRSVLAVSRNSWIYRICRRAGSSRLCSQLLSKVTDLACDRLIVSAHQRYKHASPLGSNDNPMESRMAKSRKKNHLCGLQEIFFRWHRQWKDSRGIAAAARVVRRRREPRAASREPREEMYSRQRWE